MNQLHDPYEKQSCVEQHIWRMRWLALIAFVITFLCSLIIIAVTQNALFVSIPGGLLMIMHRIIRFIFPEENQNTK